MGFFDEISKSGGSGKSQFVLQVMVQVGYNSYRKGYSPSERFFPAETPENLDELGDDETQDAWLESMEDALERALEFDGDIDDNNNKVFCVVGFKDTVLNRNPDNFWPSGDQYWANTHWTSAVREVLLPSLNEIGFNPDRETNTRFWAHLRMVPDPYDQEQGKDNPDFVPRIEERFDSKEAAVEFAATLPDVDGNTSRQNGVAPPENWNSEEAGGSWGEYVEATVSMLSEQLGEDPTPIQHTQAINSVHDALGGLVPKDKIREISENTDLSIPF